MAYQDPEYRNQGRSERFGNEWEGERGTEWSNRAYGGTGRYGESSSERYQGSQEHWGGSSQGSSGRGRRQSYGRRSYDRSAAQRSSQGGYSQAGYNASSQGSYGPSAYGPNAYGQGGYGPSAYGQGGLATEREPSSYGQQHNWAGVGGMGSGAYGSSAGRSTYSGRGPKDYQRSDERIREDANDALTRDPEIDASDIQVSVSNGEITLKGEVEDRRAKRRAEDCVEQLAGVRDVHNELHARRGFWDTLLGEDRDTEPKEVGAKGTSRSRATI
ncbi:MAG TPA: BON domain-containing protein [Gemmatimonadales bacterium]|nr:BON domain-containing protein [Gemmatimonadales bacterium]